MRAVLASDTSCLPLARGGLLIRDFVSLRMSMLLGLPSFLLSKTLILPREKLWAQQLVAEVTECEKNN